MRALRDDTLRGGGAASVLVGVCVLAITALFYGRFFDNFFIYDDFRYIENMFHESFVDVVLGYNSLRVVSNLSWWPLFQVFGYDPVGYNLFTMVITSLNGFFVFLVLARLMENRVQAGLAAVLFAASGVGSDALFWKAANSTVIGLCFYLLTLYCYIRSRQEQDRRWFMAAVALFAVAIFSKEETASLPFIILLTELLFLDCRSDRRGLILRVLPFVSLIVIYMLANYLVFSAGTGGAAEPAKFFKFRPLHTLLTGWSVFFLNPDGHLSTSNPWIYVTAVAVPLSFFWVKDRRLLWFGYGWIFFTFLPQSFTTLGQLSPRYIANSISRYMYITSIGSSIVFVAILYAIRDRLSRRLLPWGVGAFLLFHVGLNYQRVQTRGTHWRNEASGLSAFLTAMKQTLPDISGKAAIQVDDAPAGRAYMQQSLRAFYRNPSIIYIDNPLKYQPGPGEYRIIIKPFFLPDGTFYLQVYME